MRQIVTLICDECNRRNYTTLREKKSSPLNLRKYCRFCRKHTRHKEK